MGPTDAQIEDAKDRLAVLAGRAQRGHPDNRMMTVEAAGVLLDHAARLQEEAMFWQLKFEQAVSELKGTHVNVYRYTLGLEPSPLQRDHTRELLAKAALSDK